MVYMSYILVKESLEYLVRFSGLETLTIVLPHAVNAYSQYDLIDAFTIPVNEWFWAS